VQAQQNPALQTAMKVILYPALLILKASASLFSMLGAQPEIAALTTGLVASGLIGLTYLSIPALLVQRRYRAARRALKPLLGAFGAGLVSLAFAEVAGDSMLATISSTVIVLACLFLFASAPTAILSRERRSSALN